LLGEAGERFPAWVKALDGKSGVYVFRDVDDGDVLYVGESHSGRLSRTLVRHVQGWARAKQFWGRAGFSRNDPGTTYKRNAVEVAVRVVPASRAVAVQNALISELAPRDNVQGQDEYRPRKRRRRARVSTSGLPPLPF
jgi:excinuclease UvrABC nuclease subunit